jgi:gliding motility-associated-like protein
MAKSKKAAIAQEHAPILDFYVFIRVFIFVYLWAYQRINEVTGRVRGFFLLLLLFISVRDYASHLFGGELLYTHISGNTYKISFTVYGDCGAESTIFHTLYTSTPSVSIYDSSSLVQSINLKGEELGTEVSPVCPSKKDSTKCNGGTYPGVKKFTYSEYVTLPWRSANWTFIFTGVMDVTTFPSTGAGRSASITNINYNSLGIAGGNIMQVKADLNNLVFDNSSPAYSTIPTPFYCVNLAQQYNQGAIDPDGDSIAFSLVPAIDARTKGSVSYIAPFSATAPLATSTGKFIFNSLNGQITFTPNMTQDGLVVCQVSEYRKGVLVGTSEREMTFVVLDNCQGTPPAVTLQNLSAGTVTGDNVVNICKGTSHLSFDIHVANPDGDSIFIVNSSLPGSSTLNIANNNSPYPALSFDWNTGPAAGGIYTFYVTVRNNHCPLANKQTIAYSINIASPPVISTVILNSTQCLHQAYLQYNIAYGYFPHIVNVYLDGSLLKTYKDTTGIITDSLPAGSYAVTVFSDSVCTTSGNFTIPDNGNLSLLPVIKAYCIGEAEKPIYIAPVSNDAVITWFNSQRIPLYFPPVIHTSKIETDTWYFTEQYKQCYSDMTPVTTSVHPLPVAGVVMPETICLGDTVLLIGSGGVEYSWSPQSAVTTNTKGEEYIRVTTPVTLKLVVTDQYGCTDSTTVAYKDIQYCCLFSYPDAFTPNMDGKNDGFRVVSYGNLMQYHLVIFNRWGQQVFESMDPGQYWDGTFNGKPCETGTYMYYFKGQCVTGHKEQAKGDVILIR